MTGISFFIIAAFILICSLLLRRRYRTELAGVESGNKLLSAFYPLAVCIYGFKNNADKNSMQKKVAGLDPLVDAKQYAKNDFVKRVSVILAASCLILALAGLGALNDELDPLIEHNAIERASASQGDRTVSVTASNGDKDIELDLVVPSVPYTEAEAQALFDKTEAYLSKAILNGNESFDNITGDIYLPEHVSETGTDIVWEIGDLTLLGRSGRILAEEIPEEGIRTTVIAYMSCGGYERDVLFELVLKRNIQEKTEAQKVREAIEEFNERNENSSEYYLPETIDGKNVTWKSGGMGSGQKIILLGAVIIVCLYIYQRNLFRRREERRKTELESEYPMLIHRLVLYLKAGMNISKALEAITADSEKAGETDSCLYKEICVIRRETDTGISEAEAYERFGKRCGTEKYIKLGSLLVSMLRSGAGGMTDMLGDLADEASMLRREMIKRKGENAGIKLLLPLMMLLCIVMVIIMFPALRSLGL
ncbi:MAG: type II secretion system F family protein [Lachnospiraceae bacterium]|nr:type II secretion system F family protein [Lachnospiraceae bacterium]